MKDKTKIIISKKGFSIVEDYYFGNIRRIDSDYYFEGDFFEWRYEMLNYAMDYVVFMFNRYNRCDLPNSSSVDLDKIQNKITDLINKTISCEDSLEKTFKLEHYLDILGTYKTINHFEFDPDIFKTDVDKSVAFFLNLQFICAYFIDLGKIVYNELDRMDTKVWIKKGLYLHWADMKKNNLQKLN